MNEVNALEWRAYHRVLASERDEDALYRQHIRRRNNAETARLLEPDVQEQVKTLDRSIFKAKDLPLLEKVLKLLETNKLTPMLRGSAEENARRGLPRHYKDIDLLCASQGDALLAALRKAKKQHYFGKGVHVEEKGMCTYVDEVVMRYFVTQGTTIIDVNVHASRQHCPEYDLMSRALGQRRDRLLESFFSSDTPEEFQQYIADDIVGFLKGKKKGKQK
mgnify:FL=1